MKKGMVSDDNGFGTLGDRLPAESRESLEHLLTDSSGVFRRVRGYVMANPVKAVGIAALGAGALWALFATKPGRRVVDSGKSLVAPAIDGITELAGNLKSKASPVVEAAANRSAQI